MCFGWTATCIRRCTIRATTGSSRARWRGWRSAGCAGAGGRAQFLGCVQSVRPIGMLEMMDQGLADEKILCVGKNNPRYTDVWNYSEIYPHMLKEMTHFFAIYKDLEGKRVEVKGWHDAAYARNKVVEAVNRFKDNKTAAEVGGNR